MRRRAIRRVFSRRRASFWAASPIPRSHLANTPYIARFYLPFNATLQREGMGGLLTCKIKEIVVLKTSFVNACAY